jgi:hypothetical protein
MALGETEDLLHLLDEFIQDVRIHQTKQDQEGSADGGTNDSTDGAEAVEAIRDCRCCGCDNNRCDDHDSGQG